MKFILVYNTLENKCFTNFLREASQAHPDVSFLVLGDLLNVFPEFGEDIQSSILYQEIYGAEIVRLQEKFIKTGYKYPSAESLEFSALLKDALLPSGRNFEIMKREQFRRYHELFASWQSVLSSTQSKLLYLTNKMDSPDYCYVAARNCANILALDDKMIELPNGVKIGGVGGIPYGSQPFHLKSTIERLANQVSPSEYQRKLKLMWGVDILVTNISPEESPELTTFIKTSPVSLIICGAPYKQTPSASFKGSAELQDIGGKCIIHVSSFDATPKNPVWTTYIIDVLPNKLTSLLLPLEIYDWKSSPWTPDPPARTRTEEELKGNLTHHGRSQTLVLFKSCEPPKKLNKIDSARKIGCERKVAKNPTTTESNGIEGDQASSDEELRGEGSASKDSSPVRSPSSPRSGNVSPLGGSGGDSPTYPGLEKGAGRTDGEKEKEDWGEKEKERNGGREKEKEKEKGSVESEAFRTADSGRYGAGGLGPSNRRHLNRDDFIHKYEDGSWSPRIYIGVRKNQRENDGDTNGGGGL